MLDSMPIELHLKQLACLCASRLILRKHLRQVFKRGIEAYQRLGKNDYLPQFLLFSVYKGQRRNRAFPGSDIYIEKLVLEIQSKILIFKQNTVLKAAELLISEKIEDKDISIYLDSQAAITAIGSNHI
uniref:Uncharacterized protein n=1 Tax=Megaselia scalaris TaxID=36166 RepID=T1GWT5_MEGSC